MADEGRLVALLEDLYGATTPPPRRAAVQAELETLRRESGPRKWPEWVLVDNDHVRYFALTVLGDLILSGRWRDQALPQRAVVRDHLLRTLKERYAALDSFVGRKMMSTVVAIARVEWPADWPDFLPAVRACFDVECTTLLGLTLLLTVSEDFVVGAGLSSDRAEALRAALLEAVPAILELVVGTLQKALQEGPHGPSLRIALAATSSLTAYVTWVPRERLLALNLPLLPALAGCLASPDPALRIEALGAIYEIISAPYLSPVPPSVALFDGCVRLLISQLRANQPPARSSGAWVQKVSVCVAALWGAHLDRLHASSNTLFEFAGAALQFTFRQTDLSDYEEALTIWPPFVSWLEEKHTNHPSGGTNDSGGDTLQAYAPLAQALLGGLLERVFVSSVGSSDKLGAERRTLDIVPITLTATGDPEEGSLARHLSLPLPLIGQLSVVLAEFALLGTQSDGSFGLLGRHLAALCSQWGHPESQSERWSQDVQTLLSLYCYVSYEAERRFAAFFPMVAGVLSAVLTLLPQLLQTGHWRRGVASLNGTAQCLLLLQAYSHWLARFQEASEANESGAADRATYLRVIEQVAGVSLAPLEPHNSPPPPPLLLLSGTQLFAEVCAFVHVDLLLQLSPFLALVNPTAPMKLYLHDLHAQRSEAVPETVWRELFRAAAYGLLGPLPPTSPQREAQDSLLAGFLRDLRTPLERFLAGAPDLPATPSASALAQWTAMYADPKATAMVDHTLGVVQVMLETVSGSTQAQRALLHHHLQPMYPALLVLLHHAVVLRLPRGLSVLLPVLLELFKVLKRQIGLEFIQRVLGVIFDACSGPAPNPAALEPLLKLMEALVNDGHTRTFVEHIATVASEQISPLITEDTASDTAAAFHALAHTLLVRHWGHFWQPSQAPNTLQPTSQSAQAQWGRLLTAALQPLRWRDLEAFRWTLHLLRDLDDSHGAFRRAFPPSELYTLTAVLVQTLLDRTHRLHSDDVLGVLWRICNAAPATFYTEYLPALVRSDGRLTASQREALEAGLSRRWSGLQNPSRVDVGSLSHHVSEMVRDLIVFADSNAA